MRLSRTRIQDLCKQNNIQVEEIKGNKLALAELLSNKNAMDNKLKPNYNFTRNY